jgi:hypothetical protein
MPKIGDSKPAPPYFDDLIKKHGPKHTGHRRKAKPRRQFGTVLNHLPRQGIVNWAKQDSIRIGAPTPGIWAEPPTRGATLAATPKQKQNKRLRK